MTDPTTPYPGGEPPSYPGGTPPHYPVGGSGQHPGGAPPAYPGSAPPAYPGSATPAYPGSATPAYPGGASPVQSGGGQPPLSSGYPAPPPGPQGSMRGYGQDDGRGFFGALFDFSFTSFVTPKIVKFVYVLATIAIGLFVLVLVAGGFANNAGTGLLALLLAPILGLIYLAFIRMALEFCFALVRMSEDIHRTRSS